MASMEQGKPSAVVAREFAVGRVTLTGTILPAGGSCTVAMELTLCPDLSMTAGQASW